MSQIAPPRRALFTKLRHIGDVLLMTPSIRALRRACPESRIAALVPRGTEDVLAGNPDLDQLFLFDRRGGVAGKWELVRALRRYAPDLVLEMGEGDRETILGWLSGARERVGYRPEGRRAWRRALLSRSVPWNGQHVVQANLDLLRACGIPAEVSRPVLVVSPEARSRMAARLASAGLEPGGPLVVVHPVSRWLFKAWPEGRCAEVLSGLAARPGVSVAVTSGPGVKEVAAARRILAQTAGRVIDLVGQTTLPELAAVLEQARLFVGVDSAPMHMAAALGVPVVALFGPSGEHDWGPWGDGHIVLSSPYLCRPCGKDGCLGSKRSDCLEAISAQTVLQAVVPWLERRVPASVGG